MSEAERSMRKKGEERKGQERKEKERKVKERTESKGGMGECWRGRGRRER